MLVSSGSYNKASQTEWPINKGNLFLTLVEAGLLRSGAKNSWVLVRACLQTSVPSHGRKREWALRGYL